MEYNTKQLYEARMLYNAEHGRNSLVKNFAVSELKLLERKGALERVVLTDELRERFDREVQEKLARKVDIAYGGLHRKRPAA